MEMKLDLSIVEQCSVKECSYNEDNLCHAKAITIGDGEMPHCDTLFRKGPEYHFAKSVAGVGACKVSSCIYNDQLECGAASISVGSMDGEVQCLSYSAEGS